MGPNNAKGCPKKYHYLIFNYKRFCQNFNKNEVYFVS